MIEPVPRQAPYGQRPRASCSFHCLPPRQTRTWSCAQPGLKFYESETLGHAGGKICLREKHDVRATIVNARLAHICHRTTELIAQQMIRARPRTTPVPGTF